MLCLFVNTIGDETFVFSNRKVSILESAYETSLNNKNELIEQIQRYKSKIVCLDEELRSATRQQVLWSRA